MCVHQQVFRPDCWDLFFSDNPTTSGGKKQSLFKRPIYNDKKMEIPSL